MGTNLQTDETTTHVNQLEDALYRILESNRLEDAKEIAADILEEDVEMYTDAPLDIEEEFDEDYLDELNFFDMDAQGDYNDER